MFLSMQNRLVRKNCLKSINFTVKSLLAYSAVWVHPWTQNHKEIQGTVCFGVCGGDALSADESWTKLEARETLSR